VNAGKGILAITGSIVVFGTIFGAVIGAFYAVAWWLYAAFATTMQERSLFFRWMPSASHPTSHLWLLFAAGFATFMVGLLTSRNTAS
jgi:hypothetical protein